MSDNTPGQPEILLEYSDIAERTGIRLETVRMWKLRGHFPEPTVQVGNRPAWEESIIAPTIRRIMETGTPREDGLYAYHAAGAPSAASAD